MAPYRCARAWPALQVLLAAASLIPVAAAQTDSSSSNGSPAEVQVTLAPPPPPPFMQQQQQQADAGVAGCSITLEDIQGLMAASQSKLRRCHLNEMLLHLRAWALWGVRPSREWQVWISAPAGYVLRAQGKCMSHTCTHAVAGVGVAHSIARCGRTPISAHAYHRSTARCVRHVLVDQPHAYLALQEVARRRSAPCPQAALCSEALGKLPLSSPGDIACLVVEMAAQQLQPTQALVRAAASALQPALPTLPARQLSDVVCALTALGQRQEPEWLAAAVRALHSQIRTAAAAGSKRVHSAPGTTAAAAVTAGMAATAVGWVVLVRTQQALQRLGAYSGSPALYEELKALVASAGVVPALAGAHKRPAGSAPASVEDVDAAALHWLACSLQE